MEPCCREMSTGVGAGPNLADASCNIEMRTTYPYLTIPSIYVDVTHVTPVTTVERIRR